MLLYNSPEFAHLVGLPFSNHKLSSGDRSAKLVIFHSEDECYSPKNAPYTGIEYEGPAEFSLSERLLKDAVLRIQSSGFRKWTLRLAPLFYGLPGKEVYCQAGFETMVTNTVYYLPIEKDFTSGLHHSLKRKLKFLERNGWEAEKVANPDWKMVYDFIRDSRNKRGIPLNISKEHLLKSAEQLPDNYLVFEVKSKGKTAALGVVVVVSDSVLYHFLPADNPDYRSQSPVILLNKAIYEWGLAHGYSFLDLGITSESGKLQEGLALFKQRLGALSTESYVLSWEEVS